MRGRYSLGVSFAQDRLELVYLKSGWRGREVVDHVSITVPSSSHPERVSRPEVQKFLLKNGVRSTVPIVAGIPRSDLLFRTFSTPPVTERELPELVGYECERHLPGRKDDFVIGFQKVKKMRDGGYQVILAAARRDVTEGRLALLRELNLEPQSLQAVPVALASLFRYTLPESSPAILVTVEPKAFTADYLVDGKLAFSRHFPLPVMEETGGSGSDESVRKREDCRRMAAAIGEVLSRPLLLESLPEKKLPPLWLLGYGTEDSVFTDKLQNDLSVPVRLFPLYQKFQFKKGGGVTEMLASPLGLAFLGLEAGSGGMEMSDGGEESLHERPRYRFTAVLALVLVSLLFVRFGVHSFRNHQKLKEVEKEIELLVTEKTAVEELRRTVQMQRSRLLFLSVKIGGKVRQADLLKELTSIIPADTSLNSYFFREDSVEIGGLAPSSSSLLPVLENSPLFRGAEFSSDIVSQAKDLERFKIRLYLEDDSG